VSCPSGPSFQLSALDKVTPVADVDPEMVEAIQPFLEGEEGQFWPQDGWVLLDQSPELALLAHAGEEGISFMTLDRVGGEWTWSGASGAGPCPLQFTVPQGLNTVVWRGDPAAPPEPQSTELEILMTERECVSGQEIGDRLIGPQVVMTETKVFIAFATEPPPGDVFTCQGNPETPYTILLPEPLGDRQLMEGLSTGLDLADYLS
jgi:hypothetical protein